MGLWLFTENSVALDLVAEHKRYCPWINASVQSGMAGWEYMISFLEPKGSSKRTRDDIGDDGKESRFKRLREMLKRVKS